MSQPVAADLTTLGLLLIASPWAVIALAAIVRGYSISFWRDRSRRDRDDDR